MKKLLLSTLISVFWILSIYSQPISDYKFFQQNLNKEMNPDMIKEVFGKPDIDFGGSILIYRYVLADSTIIELGLTNSIRYAKHLNRYYQLLDEIYTIPTKPATIENFKTSLVKEMDRNDIIDNFGIPDTDIGSGIYIYVYTLCDSSKMVIGISDRILYANHCTEEKMEAIIE